MSKIKTFSVVLSLLVAFVTAITTYIYLFALYPLAYKQEIETAGYIHHIHPSLIASVINEESSFNNLSESRAGAIGLMQLMPQTAEWLASKLKIEYYKEKLYEPTYNINIGTYYLRYLLDEFGDEYTALCAYNAGEGQIKKWLLDTRFSSDNKTLQSTPFKETNEYVYKVLLNKQKYSTRFEL